MFIVFVIFLETACYAGRYFLGKTDVGWIYRSDSKILEEHPCVLMKTHPVLGHVSDHKNLCQIKGGHGVDSFVFYGDFKSSAPTILTLGGSTTSGFYQHYANGNTYPYLLSELLKPIGLQVVNGGHGGYGSSQELLKLITEVRALDVNTKIVISLNGINDLYTPSNNPFLHSRVQEMYKQQLWIEQGFLPKFLPNIWSFVRKFSPKLKTANETHNSSSIYKKLKPYEVWKMNINAMNSVSKSMGIKYYTFLQPTMMLEGVQSELPVDQNSSDHKMVKAFQENFIWEEGYELGYVELLRENYSKMIETCNELDFCYDISDVAPPTGNNYNNPRHHNENGNKLIAEKIYEILVNKL